MKDNIKTLIIPDVHGRDFWREPLKETLENTTANVIFLGDYLDPYPDEFKDSMDGTCDFDYHRLAIDRFKEILEFKKQYPDRITLLIGNHDGGYIWSNICECRRDKANYKEIVALFSDNADLFKLVAEDYIEDKHFIYSHAGIGNNYLKLFGNEVNESNAVDYFNEHWTKQTYGLMDSLGYYDIYRGWGGLDCPSFIWADARGWINDLQEGIGISIVGHTQFIRQINYKDKYYFLDCHKCSYMDSNGNVLDYETDKVIEKEKIEED